MLFVIGPESFLSVSSLLSKPEGVLCPGVVSGSPVSGASKALLEKQMSGSIHRLKRSEYLEMSLEI